MYKPFNAITSAIFNWLVAPLGHSIPAFALIVWPLLGGIMALLVIKRVSNQKGIAAAKDKIYVHLMEIVLYKDDVVGVLVSFVKALVYNALYVGYNIVPAVVLAPAMTVILVQLVAHYGYSPLKADEPILVQAQLAKDSGVKVTDVKLDLPEGVTLDAPPVRAADGEVVWRVRATDGDHVLTLHAGSDVESKGLAIGGEPRKIPVMRTNTWEAILYPGEDALASDSAFTTISVHYPDRKLDVFPDGEAGILGWFFITSLVAGFALKDKFGVTL